MFLSAPLGGTQPGLFTPTPNPEKKLRTSTNERRRRFVLFHYKLLELSID